MSHRLALPLSTSSAIATVSSSSARHASRLHRQGVLLLIAGFLGLGTASAHASPMTFTVTNTSDAGAGSLRAEITASNANDPGAGLANTINFNISGLPGTITLLSALPAITNSVTITGPGANQLTISGAGSYQVFKISSGTVSISGLTIANGNSTSGGGGIYNSGGTLTVSNCTVSGNSANGTGGGEGGGIYNSGGTLTVSNSTFSGNSATTTSSNKDAAGGGIFIDGGTVTIINSTFSGNSAIDTGDFGNGNGGGIYNNAGTVTLSNITFSANFTNASGAWAIGDGGAIFGTGNGGALTVNNSIFSGNYAAGVGGIGGPGSGPGGIFAGSATNVNNSVFFNNAGGDCLGCSSNTNEITADPKLLPLGSYGGTTETFLPLPGSAAICSGSISLALSAGLTADQRGFALHNTYSNCSAGIIDAGAVQTNYIEVQSAGDAGLGSDECQGTSCTLRDAIALASVSGGDIDFAAGVNSITLSNTNGTLALSGTAGIDIIGPGVANLTVNGGGSGSNFSVFTVNSGATATLYGLTVSGGNTNSVNGGGGIYNAGTLTLLNSAVTGNSASSAGGGILNDSTMTVADVTVSGNTGHVGGGIANGGTAAISQSTISGNAASSTGGGGYGGGIWNHSTLTVTESTVAGNSAETSGGGFYNDGPLILTASTISGNSAGTLGGGIGNPGIMTVSNSIVAGNSATNSANIINSFTDNGGNVVGGSTNSTNSLLNGTGAAITLSPLQYNGIDATLQTMIPLPGSAAICAGLVSNFPSGTTTDERGYPLQPTNGYCPSGSIDAGAVQTNYTGVQWVQEPPATTYALSDISPAPTVAVLETDTLLSSNNTSAVNGIPVTISFNGPGALNGTLTETTSGGVATYGNLSPTDAAMNDSLQTNAITVTSGVTLPAVTSSSFDAIGDLSQFVVSAPPTAVAGTSFSVTVTAEDAAGNTVTSFTGLLAVSSSDGSIVESPLAGYVAVTNGVGTFQATLHVAGSQTISAHELVPPAYSGTSGTITVSAATPAILTASSGTPQSTSVNTAFATALTATVTDQYGNGIGGAMVSFTAPSSGASVTLSNSGSCLTASNGSCSVTATANGTAGSYNLTAAVSGLTSVNFALTNNPPSSFVVTTLTDKTDGSPDCTSGTGNACSLRDAIGLANTAGAGNITFLASLTSVASPGTINLGSSASPAGTGTPLPDLSGYVNIIGPGANQLTVSGNNDFNVGSVFTVNSGATATLYGLTIADGQAYCSGSVNGGGICNSGTLAVMDSAVSGNHAGGNGGGILSSGALTVTGSTVSGNTAGIDGGGIESPSGTLTIAESTISGNSATNMNDGDGGGIWSRSFTLTDSTVSGNFASCSGGGSPCSGAGGGIYLASGTLTASNSIVAGNTTQGTLGSGDCDRCGSLGSSNLIGGTPELSALQYNGIGATLQTMIPLPGSPAICAGESANIPSGTTTDERDYPLATPSYCSSGQVDAGAVQTNYTSVAFVQQPTNVDFPAAISPAPTVEILETDTLFGANNTDAVNGISLTLDYSSGSGNIGGSLTQITAGGVATFPSLTPQTTGDDFSFTASVPVTTAGSGTTLTVTSNPFDVIAPGDILNFSPNPPAGATAGNTYLYQLSAAGGIGPYTYSATGLPAGLQLLGSMIAGQCVASSTNVYLTANDSETPPQTATAGPFSIVCNPAPVITTTSLPQAFVNVPYSTTLTETGGSGPPTAWTLTPSVTGFSIDPATGILSGTATSTGSLTFNIRFTDMWGATDNKQLTLAVNPPPTFVVNTTTDDATGTASDCTPTEGTCTLRDALAAAAAAGTGAITFDPAVFASAQTITLTNGTLGIPSFTTITGPGAGILTVSGNNANVVFEVAGGATVSISGITAANGYGQGAGIKNSGTLTLSSCVVTGNESQNDSGAGIANRFGGILTIQNCTISNNLANGLGVNGAGLDNRGTATIVDSTLSGNSVINGQGGAIDNESSGTLTLVDSTLTANQVTDDGGNGIHGGAIYSQGVLVVQNSTITGNSQLLNHGTGDSGGGIYTRTATCTLSNTIVAGNTDTGGDPDIEGSCVDGGNNLIGDDSGTAGLIAGMPNPNLSFIGTAASPLNPVLSALASYGGPTQTMIPLPGSPAICAGTLTNATSASITADQRGFVFDPNCPTGSVDAGAVQTNYALNFTAQQPSNVIADQTMSPAPIVTVTESGSAFTASPATVSVADADSVLASSPATATTANGQATFGSLQFNTAESTDSLTATLALNPALATPLSIAVTSANFSVTQIAQSISFAPASPVTYGIAPITLSATGGASGNSVTFSILSGSAFGSLSGTNNSLLTVTGAGTIVIAANQAGNTDYSAAPQVMASIVVSRAASITSLNLSSTTITPLQTVTFTATVASTTTGTPTGTVNFYDSTTLLNSTPAAVTAGVATYTTLLAPGITHTIVATYSGDVNFTGSSNTSTAAVTVLPLDFTLVISGPSSQTVIPGSTITYQVTVTPKYGSYAGTVSFAVNGLPPGATVTFSPSSIAANGGPQTITVTIQTAAVTAASHAPSPPSTSRRIAPFAFAFLLLFGAGALRKQRRAFRRLLSIVALLVGGAAAISTLSGCGGNGFFTHAPENYNITLTVTSATLQHTATFTLNVQ